MSEDAPVARFAGIDAGELAGTAARRAVTYFSDGENQAAFAGAFLLPVLVFRGSRARVPLLPFVIVALMGDRAARLAYRASKNLEVIAQAASADDAP